jgi:hypothetical protein
MSDQFHDSSSSYSSSSFSFSSPFSSLSYFIFLTGKNRVPSLEQRLRLVINRFPLMFLPFSVELYVNKKGW